MVIVLAPSMNPEPSKLKLASIPAVYVYGIDGELKKRFDESSGKAFSYEHDINPLVEELLKAAPK